MKWFFGWLAPHPTGGLGLEEQHFGIPLLTGLEVHDGLATLYQTGDSEAAILSLQRANQENSTRYKSEEDQRKSYDQAIELLNNYILCYEQDPLRVTHLPDGTPAVEVELEVDLGYNDYCYTARLDTYVHDQYKHYYPLEHKTVDTTRKSQLMREMDTSAQATGQIFLATHLLPDTPPTGLIVNMLVKRAAKSATPEQRNLRHYTYRTAQDLEKFRLDITSTLKTLDDCIGLYLDLSSNGMEPYEASRQAFVMACGKDCAWCQFQPLCLNPGTRDLFSAFIARSTEDDTE